MDDVHVMNIRESAKKYEVLMGEIKELEEEERRLREELEKVRHHLTYYSALVTDMKKRLRGTSNLDIFDHI